MNFECKITDVIVKDLNVSVAFYRDVLGQVVKYQFESYVVFDKFALWQSERAHRIVYQTEHNNGAVCEKCDKFGLYFETDDIEKAYADLQKKNVHFIHGIRHEIWGQRTIRLHDPDGNIIDIGERIGSRVTKPLPVF